jgi:hypothetical protein
MKLNDTQLMLLSSASQRDDGLVAIPANLKDAAPKAVKPLLKAKLLIEIAAKPDMPVWRRDDDGAHALQVTQSGLAAIGISDGADAQSPFKEGEAPKAASKGAKPRKAGAATEEPRPTFRAGPGCQKLAAPMRPLMLTECELLDTKESRPAIAFDWWTVARSKSTMNQCHMAAGWSRIKM